MNRRGFFKACGALAALAAVPTISIIPPFFPVYEGQFEADQYLTLWDTRSGRSEFCKFIAVRQTSYGQKVDILRGGRKHYG